MLIKIHQSMYQAGTIHIKWLYQITTLSLSHDLNGKPSPQCKVCITLSIISTEMPSNELFFSNRKPVWNFCRKVDIKYFVSAGNNVYNIMSSPSWLSRHSGLLSCMYSNMYKSDRCQLQFLQKRRCETKVPRAETTKARLKWQFNSIYVFIIRFALKVSPS